MTWEPTDTIKPMLRGGWMQLKCIFLDLAHGLNYEWAGKSKLLR